MKYLFEINDDLCPETLADPLQLDSGTVIATLRSGGYTVRLETEGEVKVMYNPDPEGSYEDGTLYTVPSLFPDTLKRLIAEGADIESMGNVHVEESNWFTLAVYLEDGSGKAEDMWTGFSDGLCPEDLSAMSILGYLLESLNYYLTHDTGLSSRVGSVRLSAQEFDGRWKDRSTDDMDEDDMLSFKEDCFAMYETAGFNKVIEPVYMQEGDENYGQAFEVLRRANVRETDIEAMPMWKVRFANGNISYCYPEEICSAEKAKKSEKQ